MRKASLGEFFPDRFIKKLEAAKDIPAIFQVVVQAVHEQMGIMRSGLDLGLVELAGSNGRFIGCLHPFGTNMILVNKLPLRRVKESSPQTCKSYLFLVLLHEYLHTFGVWDEREAREGALALTKQLFGDDHPITKLAEGMESLLPFVIYPTQMPLPLGIKIEPLEG